MSTDLSKNDPEDLRMLVGAIEFKLPFIKNSVKINKVLMEWTRTIYKAIEEAENLKEKL